MKYLISLYFDEKTNKQIMQYMEAVAKATGNDYMLANKVPPHITVSSFDTEKGPESSFIRHLEERIAESLEDVKAGEVQWIGCGAFMSSVLYLTPVLNEYLQIMEARMYASIAQASEENDIKISKYYRPYEWLPHTTIGKKLNEEELCEAFRSVQCDFRILRGKVVRVGLAKASPYEEIKEWKL